MRKTFVVFCRTLDIGKIENKTNTFSCPNMRQVYKGIYVIPKYKTIKLKFLQSESRILLENDI